MPLQGEGKVFGVSKKYGSSQKGKHHLNEGKIPCLESKDQPPVLATEREKQNMSINPHHPTFSESQLSPQGLGTFHSSPTGFLPDHGNKSTKLKPQIIGRVMSEIHSNLPHKDFASEDFLHVLVDRVIAEVANEINLYDKGAPLIFPALAQTNILPKQCCQFQKCCQSEKTESPLNSQIYEENSDSSIEARKPSNEPGQREEVNTERKSPPSEITVSVVLSESSSESATPSECSVECCPGAAQGFYKKFKEKAKKLLTSRKFWWTLFLILFTLCLLFLCIILGAFLGLAICGPHSCYHTLQSHDAFRWIYLKQSHNTIANVHGLF